jgi:predicted enzyme related to lactoylglutathione lyase
MTRANEPAVTVKSIKGVAIPVVDEARARRFYGEVVGLPVADREGEPGGFRLGSGYLLLKPEWYAAPSAEPSPRVTLEVTDASAAAEALAARGVTIADPVVSDGDASVGSFLDSEGNKLWICSVA